MIPKSGYRFSEKIMHKQNPDGRPRKRAEIRDSSPALRFAPCGLQTCIASPTGMYYNRFHEDLDSSIAGSPGSGDRGGVTGASAFEIRRRSRTFDSGGANTLAQENARNHR